MKKNDLDPLYVDENGDAWFRIYCPSCGTKGEQRGYDENPCFCYDCAEKMLGKDVVDYLRGKKK